MIDMCRVDKNISQKQILVIAYFYPPIPEIGSIRTWKLVKYIRAHGFEPIVICGETYDANWTYELPDVQVYRIKCHFLFSEITNKFKKALCKNNKVSSDDITGNISRLSSIFLRVKLITLKLIYIVSKYIYNVLYEILASPDMYFKWHKQVLLIAQEIIENHNISLIYSSSGPSTDLIIASDLSKKYGIPWIADYRDLWTKNHYESHSFFRAYFDRKLEFKTLQSASAVVAASEPAATIQSEFLKKLVTVITNGYDPDDYFYYTQSSNVFTISYTGIIYSGKQDPSMLFAAVDKLIKTNKICRDKIRIKFYGSERSTLNDFLAQYDLDKVVEIYDRIPLKQSIIEQKKSTLLLLLMWSDISEKGVYTGKVFEYLGARRPILAIPANEGSVVDVLLRQTNAGVSFADLSKLETFILDCYDTFYKTGQLPYYGIDDEIIKYSRTNQAKQFADIFVSVLSNYEKNKR